MSASANQRDVRLRVTISPQAARALDQLLATGLYGVDRQEAAQRLIYDRLQRFLPAEKLQPRPAARARGRG
jgi:hypothetical protein